MEGGSSGGNAHEALAQHPVAPPPRPRAPHTRGRGEVEDGESSAGRHVEGLESGQPGARGGGRRTARGGRREERA